MAYVSHAHGECHLVAFAEFKKKYPFIDTFAVTEANTPQKLLSENSAGGAGTQQQRGLMSSAQHSQSGTS